MGAKSLKEAVADPEWGAKSLKEAVADPALELSL